MAINVEVKPKNNESPEAMIKRFVKKVKKEGIIDEWRNRCMYYEKPSVGRRLKKIYKKKLAKKAQKEYDDKYKD
tara:strand:- start:221 stop:442 length:222 start_codon:yes stop_codon:yes gene_type:complete